MANWGLNLGLCFQIMDDYIDMTSDTETLGKPAGSDIVQEKRTLIAIHALESGADLPTFRKLFGTESTDSDELPLLSKNCETMVQFNMHWIGQWSITELHIDV